MLNRTTKTGLVSILAAASIVASLATSAPSTTPLHALEGVWEIHGASTSPGGPPSFVNVSLITRDGDIVNVDPQVGTAIGRIERTGPATFATRFFGYLDSNGPAEYEVSGGLRLTGQDNFAGPFTTTIRDLGGNVLSTYQGNVSAVRK